MKTNKQKIITIMIVLNLMVYLINPSLVVAGTLADTGNSSEKNELLQPADKNKETEKAVIDQPADKNKGTEKAVIDQPADKNKGTEKAVIDQPADKNKETEKVETPLNTKASTGSWGETTWERDRDNFLTVSSGKSGDAKKAPWNGIIGGGINHPKIKFNNTIITDMEYLFKEKTLINFMGLEGLVDLSTTESMKGAFKSINIPNSVTMFTDTGTGYYSVTDMSELYMDANLKDQRNLLDFSKTKSDNVTDMSHMFDGLKIDKNSVFALDLTSLNMTKVTNMTDMFANTKINKLTLGANVKLDETVGLPAPKGDENLVWQKEDGSSKQYTAEEFMANYGSGTGDLTPGTYVGVEKKEENEQMWGTSQWEFDEETGTLSIGEGELDGPGPWKSTTVKIDPKAIKKIHFTGPVKAPSDSTELFGTFNGLTGHLLKLEILDLTNLDTSEVTSMKQMFGYLDRLETLDISMLKTTKVEDMTEMFTHMSSLTSLDFSSFETSSVTNMKGMFSENRALEVLDLSQFVTGQVRDMSSMFLGLSTLESIQLGNFNTANVTNMSSMFSKVAALEVLDLSSFDTTKVTSMNGMFTEVSALGSLSLGNQFRFMMGADLPSPKSNSELLWTKEDGTSSKYTPTDFMTSYGEIADLDAATYIGKKAIDLATLAISDIEAASAVIGDESTLGFTINHTDASMTDAIATNLTVDLSQLFAEWDFKGNDLMVQTIDEDGAVSESNPMPINQETKTVTLSDITNKQKLKLTLKGTPWNNSTAGEENATLTIKYFDGEVEQTETKRFYQEVLDGDLKFAEIPSSLPFKKSIFPAGKTNQIIPREESDWHLKVEDYRGTNSQSQSENTSNRINWEIAATATQFHEVANPEVMTRSLELVYSVGDEHTPITDVATTIHTQDVTGETPIINHETTVRWDENTGLQLRVLNTNDLDTEVEYSANLELDLRKAP